MDIENYKFSPDLDFEFNKGRVFIQIDFDRGIWTEITKGDVVALPKYFNVSADDLNIKAK